MRKSLVIALVIVHLFGNTELGQVFRLPRLITHFCQHHRIDGDISFFDFLQMHYSGDDGTRADDDIDSKLPFKNLTQNTIFGVYSPMVIETQVPGCPLRQSPVYANHLRHRISSKHVLMVLQPPRAA